MDFGSVELVLSGIDGVFQTGELDRAASARGLITPDSVLDQVDDLVELLV